MTLDLGRATLEKRARKESRETEDQGYVCRVPLGDHCCCGCCREMRGTGDLPELWVRKEITYVESWISIVCVVLFPLLPKSTGFVVSKPIIIYAS